MAKDAGYSVAPPPFTATWLQGESSQLPDLIENIIPNNQKN